MYASAPAACSAAWDNAGVRELATLKLDAGDEVRVEVERDDLLVRSSSSVARPGTDSGHEVSVTLPLHSTVAPIERAWLRELEHRGTLTGTDRIALVHAARGEALTNTRVRQLLGVDRAAATEILGRLRDEGFLDQRGQRGGASYRLAGTLRPPAGLRLSDTDLRDLVVDLAAGGPVTNADVRRATGLDRTAALALLERLLAAGRLQRIGERRGTKYLLP